MTCPLCNEEECECDDELKSLMEDMSEEQEPAACCHRTPQCRDCPRRTQ